MLINHFFVNRIFKTDINRMQLVRVMVALVAHGGQVSCNLHFFYYMKKNRIIDEVDSEINAPKRKCYLTYNITDLYFVTKDHTESFI